MVTSFTVFFVRRVQKLEKSCVWSVVAMVTGYVQFDVCAEAEETVEHRAYGTSHQSETAALRNTRLMREYYGSPSYDGHGSAINHKNYKQFVQKIMRN
jgi:hypothetical protein